LNFVERELERSGDDYVVMRFNPWWFSGRGDLALQFLGQMAKSFAKWSALGKQFRRSLASYGQVLSTLPVPGSGVAGGVAGALKPGDDVPALKAKIADALGKQKRRLIIVVDDIDRLMPREIVQVLTLIKAVADFPNTVYLLAFDRDLVIQALE